MESLNRKIILILILLLLLAGSGMYILNERVLDQKEQVAAHVAVNSELERRVNKKGEETVSRQPVIISSEKDFKRLDVSYNKELVELQRLVKELKGKVEHAAIIASTTRLERIVPTHRDTVDAIVIYTGHYEDKWVTWDGRADPDSFRVNFLISNVYEYGFAYENRLFKKPVHKVSVKNLNPHTRTDEVNAVDINGRTDRFSLGPSVSYGINPLRWREDPRIIIGLGVQYKLIGIK